MKMLSRKNAKYGFNRLIDIACAEPVGSVKHDRDRRMTYKAIHNKIVSSIGSTKANIGSRSRLTPDSRTLSADAQRSESRR